MIRLTVPAIGDEECAAVERVLRGGYLVHGPEGEAFEQELAAYLGCRDVVVVSSGTAALHLSLVALGIGQGDAVFVPDFTFPATANMVEAVGARPVFVDVDPGTYNMTPAGLDAALRAWSGPEKPKAVIPVHEFGCPVDMTGLLAVARSHDLHVIEDAACGLGAVHQGKKVGTLGVAGCFSFHPRKAITTGEGGAIAVNDAALAVQLRHWRNHGIAAGPGGMEFVLPGFNYRLTNFQSALGRVQLRKFNGWVAERRLQQRFYREALSGLPVRLPEEVEGHSWQTFMVFLPENLTRSKVIALLREKGVESNLGAQCLHVLDFYRRRYPADCAAHGKNVASSLYERGLALPLYQGLSGEDMRVVAESFREVVETLLVA